AFNIPALSAACEPKFFEKLMILQEYEKWFADFNLLNVSSVEPSLTKMTSAEKSFCSLKYLLSSSTKISMFSCSLSTGMITVILNINQFECNTHFALHGEKKLRLRAG